LRRLIKTYDREIARIDARLHARLKGDTGHEAVQAIHVVGRVFAAVFVAEIGPPPPGYRRSQPTRHHRELPWSCFREPAEPVSVPVPSVWVLNARPRAVTTAFAARRVPTHSFPG
jgi:hypothetical protein